MYLETSHHAGIMSPVEHIFPLGCNTADTQVRGSTTDTRKAGAGAQTESPGLIAGGEAGMPSAEKVLASQVNWHLVMVSCVSNSGQFLLDSSPCVNFIIPVVATKTSHSGDENWGDRGSSWDERHQNFQANMGIWGWS